MSLQVKLGDIRFVMARCARCNTGFAKKDDDPQRYCLPCIEYLTMSVEVETAPGTYDPLRKYDRAIKELEYWRMRAQQLESNARYLVPLTYDDYVRGVISPAPKCTCGLCTPGKPGEIRTYVYFDRWLLSGEIDPFANRVAEHALPDQIERVRRQNMVE